MDKYTGGFQDTDLIIIAARPSMGKTALSLTLARNMAFNGYKVGFFSLEMDNKQLMLRLISSTAKVNLQKIRTATTNQQESQRIIEAYGNLNDTDMYFDDSAMLETIRTQCKEPQAKSRI